MQNERAENNRFPNGNNYNFQPQSPNNYNPNPAYSPNSQPQNISPRSQYIRVVSNPNFNQVPYQDPNQYQVAYQPNNKLSEQQNYEPEQSLSYLARNNFIKKVYLLLTLQLLLTVAVGYFAYNSTAFREIFANTAAVIVLSVALLAITIVISCCTEVFRKFALPLFITFTLLMSVMVAIAICGYQSKVVLTAAGITLLLAAALTIYAWNTTSDITDGGPYLMAFGLALLIFGIVAIFWRDPIVQLIYSCLSAFLFAIYLIYDTQRILGTKKYSYSLDDSYLAAIQLYIDVIQLFLNLLKIVGYFSRN